MNRYILFIILYIFINISVYSDSENIINGKKAYAEKKYDLAIQYFKKEISLNPKQCFGYYYIGLTFERMQQKEKSIQEFIKATKTQCPSNLLEQSYWKIVNYYRFIEDWENLYVYSKAFLKIKYNSEVDKYLRLAENNYNPEKLKLANLIKQAKDYEEQSKLEEAAEVYIEIYKINEKIESLLKAADLYRTINNNQKSIEIYKNILEIQPKNWFANSQMAVYFYNNGEPEKALPYIEQSYSYIPKSEYKNLYSILIIKGFIYFNLENFNKVNDVLNEINEKFSLYKEKNYYVLYYLMERLNQNYKENVNQMKNFSEVEISLIKFIEYFQKEEYYILYNNFINLFNNTKEEKDLLRYSNYWNQIYIVLLLNSQNQQEQLNFLYQLKDNILLKKILSCSYRNYLIETYLSNFRIDETQLLEKELINILKEIPYTNNRDLVLLYSAFKLNDFLYLNDILKDKNEDYLKLNHKKLNAMLYYFQSIVYLNENKINDSYELLKKSIDLNSDYKVLAKENAVIKELIQTNEEWRKLLEESPILRILKN